MLLFDCCCMSSIASITWLTVIICLSGVAESRFGPIYTRRYSLYLYEYQNLCTYHCEHKSFVKE